MMGDPRARMVMVGDYDVLRWLRSPQPPDSPIFETTALAEYRDNWCWIAPERIDPAERRFIKYLMRTHGGTVGIPLKLHSLLVASEHLERMLHERVRHRQEPRSARFEPVNCASANDIDVVMR